MPIFNVTLKENADEAVLQEAMDRSQEQGGEIKHKFTLIKGFTVQFPPDKVKVLETTEHIHVEEDKEVKTQ